MTLIKHVAKAVLTIVAIPVIWLVIVVLMRR